MAAAYIPGIVQESFQVSASGTITLSRPAMAIVSVVFLNGGATSVAMQTGTVQTATSTVTNAFTFTGTAEDPSSTITANSGLGTDSAVFVKYIPANAVGADQ